MKRLLVCLMAGVLVFAVGACGRESTDAEVPEVTSVSSEAADDVSADKAAGAGEKTEDETKAEAREEDTSEMQADALDLSNCVDGALTSLTDPVPLGTWAKASLYATQDDAYHTVYVCVTGVTKQSDDTTSVVSAINTNNEYVVEDEWISVSDFDIPTDGELVVLEYEVYVPEDFPAPSYGMTEPKLYFTVRNIDGAGIPSAYSDEVYIGLSSTEDLAVRPKMSDYYPGHVYAEKCIYVMVKGYDDYVVTYFSFPDGTKSEEMSTDNMYTVYHAVK